MSFGERIKKYRLQWGVSQEVASGLCGISREEWSRYERGRSLPGYESLGLMARGMGVSADWLLGLTDVKKNINV